MLPVYSIVKSTHLYSLAGVYPPAVLRPAFREHRALFANPGLSYNAGHLHHGHHPIHWEVRRSITGESR
jgi:hypothetical protein